MSIKVLSTDEYKAQEFDAVLVRENTVVCVAKEVDLDHEGAAEGEALVRTIPLQHVTHADADPDTMLTGAELPDWFYGGGRYGFVDLEVFPDVEDHLEDLQREAA